MTKPLYQHIASSIDARLRCIKHGNAEWKAKHADNLNQLADLLPNGSGIDNGTAIDWEKSTGEKLIMRAPYHHMDDGYYNGWTEHTITIRPSLIHTVSISVSGRNHNDIKDYLGELFAHALTLPVEQTYDAVTEETRYQVVRS